MIGLKNEINDYTKLDLFKSKRCALLQIKISPPKKKKKKTQRKVHARSEKLM